MQKGLPTGRPLSLSKIPFGAFRQFFAVCCAHHLSADSRQIPHLQPEKYFLPGTRPGRKCFLLYFLLTQKTLRGFFYSLKGLPTGRPFILLQYNILSVGEGFNPLCRGGF